MTKATIVALAGLMAVSSVAGASMNRANAFGKGGRFIADPTDKWSLASVEANVGDVTYGEFGGSTAAGDNWGGVDMNLGGGVLGIYGNRPVTEFGNIFNGGTFGTASIPTIAVPNSAGITAPLGLEPGSVNAPTRQIDIIYGMAVNDKTSIGIGLNRAVSSEVSESTPPSPGVATKNSAETSILGVNLGVGLKDLGAISELLIGLQYGMGSSVNSEAAAVTNKYSATGSDISVRVNGTMNGEGGKFSGFDVTFNTTSLDFKDEPSTALATSVQQMSKNTGMAWALGYASGMSSDMGQGLGGIVIAGSGATRDESSADGTSIVDKYTKNGLSVDIVASGEAKANSVLTLRTGLSTEVYGTSSATHDSGSSTALTKDSMSLADAANTVVSLGATLAAGDDVSVDTTFSEGLNPAAGVWGSMFGSVSLTMNWGKKAK